MAPNQLLLSAEFAGQKREENGVDKLYNEGVIFTTLSGAALLKKVGTALCPGPLSVEKNSLERFGLAAHD